MAEDLTRSEKLISLVGLADSILRATRNMTWVGRIHLQKMVFFSQLVSGDNLGYKFTIYQYGPYSADLDGDILDLTSFGGLRLQIVNGFPDYQLGDYSAPLIQAFSANPKIVRFKPIFDQVSKEFASMRSRDLELLSTIAYVKALGIQGPEMTRLVLNLKPHFTQREVEKAETQMEDALGRVRAALDRSS